MSSKNLNYEEKENREKMPLSYNYKGASEFALSANNVLNAA